MLVASCWFLDFRNKQNSLVFKHVDVIVGGYTEYVYIQVNELVIRILRHINDKYNKLKYLTLNM